MRTLLASRARGRASRLTRPLVDPLEGRDLVSSLWVSDPPSAPIAQPVSPSPATATPATATPIPRPSSPASPISIRPLRAAAGASGEPVAADATAWAAPPSTAPVGILLPGTDATGQDVPSGLLPDSLAQWGPATAPSRQPGIAPGAIRLLTAAPAPPNNSAPPSPGVAAAPTPTSSTSPAVVADSAPTTTAPSAAASGSGVSFKPAASSGGSTTPTLSAPLTSLIGGQEKVTLTAPSGKQLSSVTWQISGAKQGQNYSLAVRENPIIREGA